MRILPERPRRVREFTGECGTGRRDSPDALCGAGPAWHSLAMRAPLSRATALLLALLFLLHLPLLPAVEEEARADAAAHSHAAGQDHPDHDHEHHCMPSCQTVAAVAVVPALGHAQVRLAAVPLATPPAGAPEGAVSSPDPPPPRSVLFL